jgi:hypothetical protein
MVITQSMLMMTLDGVQHFRFCKHATMLLYAQVDLTWNMQREHEAGTRRGLHYFMVMMTNAIQILYLVCLEV